MINSLRLPVIRPGLRRMARLAVMLTTLLLWLPAIEAMAAPSKSEPTLVNVADTRALGPGITRWIADVYNTSYWQFALLVVVIMAAMGLILGYVCDQLMGLLGINLGKMQHHE